MNVFQCLISAICASFLFSTPTTASDQHTIDPGKVLGFVIGDWNKDGGMDRAVLVSPDDMDDDVGLYIYFQDDELGSRLAIYKPNLVWSGSLWGSTPSLKVTSAGSLQVVSQNQAIGRNRWIQTLTIAYRNNEFLVAGYTYNAYDTLDPNAGISCDVNLLTGGGIKNKKRFKSQKRLIKLADWSEQMAPEQCQE